MVRIDKRVLFGPVPVVFGWQLQIPSADAKEKGESEDLADDPMVTFGMADIGANAFSKKHPVGVIVGGL